MLQALLRDNLYHPSLYTFDLHINDYKLNNIFIIFIYYIYILCCVFIVFLYSIKSPILKDLSVNTFYNLKILLSNSENY